MNTPVYFISDIHLKLTLDEGEKKRRGKLYVINKKNPKFKARQG